MAVVNDHPTSVPAASYALVDSMLRCIEFLAE